MDVFDGWSKLARDEEREPVKVGGSLDCEKRMLNGRPDMRRSDEMSQLVFKFGPLFFEPERPPPELVEDWVAADFQIEVNGRCVYREESLNVAELAVSLTWWLEHGFLECKPFEWITIDAEEVGIVWLRPESDGTWRVGSIWQSEAAQETHLDHVIEGAILDFCCSVVEALKAEDLAVPQGLT